MALDERLNELTEENARQKAEIERLKKEAEDLQIECANKIATAKVEFETKELNLKKQIRDLTANLELRNSNERALATKSTNKSISKLWDEALTDGEK
jgi:predicted RNase H-like nuclease (RuvC/YqgF family)